MAASGMRNYCKSRTSVIELSSNFHILKRFSGYLQMYANMQPKIISLVDFFGIKSFLRKGSFKNILMIKRRNRQMEK